MELNDLAQQTTSLDISGIQLTDFIGLDVLPNLTDLNLQNNGYKMTFDLSTLPSQITGIDLRRNEIYELKGLAKVNVAENREESVTVQHPLKKLILPESAKYNQEEILGFYEKNRNEIEKGGIEMQILNKAGKLDY